VGRDDDGTGPPARRPARDEVERLLAERGEHLMRAAMALTGSRSDGEDLLQAALERLLRRWSPRVTCFPCFPTFPQ
jgi:DNA-directed RNA polymerase specialized sigma24 family protein